jgi:hypothetical protein
LLVLLPPPPQAEIPIAIDASNSIGMEIVNSLRRFRLPQPAIGASRSEKTAPAPTTSAAVTLLLIVRVVAEAAVPFGVTLVGLKMHVELAGRPEHAKVVTALNPLSGVTVTVIAAGGVPAVADPLVGVTERLKSAAGGAFTVTESAEEVEVRFPMSPP